MFALLRSVATWAIANPVLLFLLFVSIYALVVLWAVHRSVTRKAEGHSVPLLPNRSQPDAETTSTTQSGTLLSEELRIDPLPRDAWHLDLRLTNKMSPNAIQAEVTVRNVKKWSDDLGDFHSVAGAHTRDGRFAPFVLQGHADLYYDQPGIRYMLRRAGGCLEMTGITAHGARKVDITLPGIWRVELDVRVGSKRRDEFLCFSWTAGGDLQFCECPSKR